MKSQFKHYTPQLSSKEATTTRSICTRGKKCVGSIETPEGVLFWYDDGTTDHGIRQMLRAVTSSGRTVYHVISETVADTGEVIYGKLNLHRLEMEAEKREVTIVLRPKQPAGNGMSTDG